MDENHWGESLILLSQLPPQIIKLHSLVWVHWLLKELKLKFFIFQINKKPDNSPDLFVTESEGRVEPRKCTCILGIVVLLEGQNTLGVFSQ